MLDSVEKRFRFLEPHITAYGPTDDSPRPAVLLFHACNGVRAHIHAYAQAAAGLDVRAFVIDSFTPRGWDHAAAVSLVCSGLALHGYERSGDVLAATWGIAQRGDVDGSRLMLAGWSHGGWAIMDLMTQKLIRTGEARLRDPNPGPLMGVRSVFLVYPYINFPARSNTHGWEYRPRTFAVLATQDFLTAHAHGESVFRHFKAEGVPVETLVLDATHCFDEDSSLHFGPLMTYHRPSHAAAGAAFAAFIQSTLV